jgi:hypothetical protein
MPAIRYGGLRADVLSRGAWHFRYLIDKLGASIYGADHDGIKMAVAIDPTPMLD